MSICLLSAVVVNSKGDEQRSEFICPIENVAVVLPSDIIRVRHFDSV